MKPARLYVGTQNDALFLIDGPPRPAPIDDMVMDGSGPRVIARMEGASEEDGRIAEAIAAQWNAAATPLPMILHCPACGAQHIDRPAPEKGWTNPPHRSHECQTCGVIWRPADVPTEGVERIETRGTADTWDGRPGALLALADMQTHQSQDSAAHAAGECILMAIEGSYRQLGWDADAVTDPIVPQLVGIEREQIDDEGNTHEVTTRLQVVGVLVEDPCGHVELVPLALGDSALMARVREALEVSRDR